LEWVPIYRHSPFLIEIHVDASKSFVIL